MRKSESRAIHAWAMTREDDYNEFVKLEQTSKDRELSPDETERYEVLNRDNIYLWPITPAGRKHRAIKARMEAKAKLRGIIAEIRAKYE